VKVKTSVNGMPMFSRARPRSSGEVVMKKIEKQDIKARNFTVIADEYISVDPVKKFITKIRIASKVPPFIETDHLFSDLARPIIGIWASKAKRRTSRFENIRQTAKMLMTRMNLALGSI